MQEIKVIQKHHFYLLGLTVIFILHIVGLEFDDSPFRAFDPGQGIYAHNARMKLIADKFIVTDFAVALLGSPIFTYNLALFFELFDLSYWSLRLATLLPLWLVIILLYFILRKRIGTDKSLLFCLLVSLSHELYMWAKFTQPFTMQMAAYCTVFFLFQIASKKNKDYCFALLGAFLVSIIFIKLTGIFFLFSFGSFLIFQIFRKKLTKKHLFIIAASFLCLLSLVFITYIFPSIELYNKYLTSPFLYRGHFNLSKNLYLFFTIPIRFSNLFHYFPVLFVFLLSLLWFAEQFKSIIFSNFKTWIIKISDLELFCLTWIFGTTFSLVLNGQLGSDKRYVDLLIPFYILAGLYAFDKNKRFKISKLKLHDLFSLTIITISFSYVIRDTFINLYKEWISYLSPPGFVFDTLSNWSISICLTLLIMGFLLSRYSKETLKVVLYSYLFLNLTIYITLFFSNRFTLREASREIQKKVINEKFITGAGEFNHYLSIGVKKYLIPIYFKHSELEHSINKSFFKKVMNNPHLLLLKKDKTSYQTGFELPSNNQYEKIAHFQLSPLPFTNIFKEEFDLYRFKGRN